MDRVGAEVCIVGAGYAGLAAARRLRAHGKSVVVLEARDRVGGQAKTLHDGAGISIDLGASFVGPGQEAVSRLAHEVGVATVPTPNEGDLVTDFDGRIRSSTRTAPKLGPGAVTSLGVAVGRIEKMAKRVPTDAPWGHHDARLWDRQSLGDWIHSPRNVPTRPARRLLDLIMRGLFASDPYEVSLLSALVLFASNSGLLRLVSIRGGSKQNMLLGGAQEIAERMAAELGDAVMLERTVRTITQHDGGCLVHAGGVVADAARVIVAVPTAIAGRIAFEPSITSDRALLWQRTKAGPVTKFAAVYAEPFWRHDGLSGESAAPDSAIPFTLDASPPATSAGVLIASTHGSHAQQLALATQGERRDLLLRELATRFGDAARRPERVVEYDWAADEWTRGGSITHYAPTVLTHFGRTLRQPDGRIHWAGTDTATKSTGTLDGAIRSGHRAADEIIALA